ncbi:MAG: HAD-IC family P-type ATPase [Chloroflexota bacterium]
MPAVISLTAGKTADAIAIGVVIIVNTLIGFFQEYQAEEALQALQSKAAPEAEVLRDCPDRGACIEMRVPATQIVPGDVVLLDAGDKVPADARLLETFNLKIDEAMLTGESISVRKEVAPLEGERSTAERTNLAYGGTIVTSGRGKGVVYATGDRTEMGKIAMLIRETEKVPSPLQKQTLDLSKKLGMLAVGVAATTLLLGLIRGLAWEDMFLFALASAVSSIPEGLPVVMSITLAVGVNRMAKRNAIIRRLQAVDTLGAATVICTDKTGTLTTNQMTVQQVTAGGKTIHVTGVGFAPEGRFERNGERFDPTSDPDIRLALHVGALCNDARIINREILINVAYVPVFMAVGTLWAFTRAERSGSLIYAQTVAFTTLAMFQVFNSLNCRSRDKSIFRLGVFSNPYLIGAIVLSVVLQLAAQTVPFMQTALGTVRLDWGDWGGIVLIAGSILVADEARKLVSAALR